MPRGAVIFLVRWHAAADPHVEDILVHRSWLLVGTADTYSTTCRLSTDITASSVNIPSAVMPMWQLPLTLILPYAV